MSKFTTFNTIEHNGITFVLKGSECTNKNWQAVTGPDGLHNTNSHTIRVAVVGGQTYTSFEYWTSVSQGSKMSDEDLIDALYCFMDDAQAGMLSFDEFVDEFGYDDPKLAYRIWNICKNSKDKLKRIWPNENFDDEIYDWLNFIQEEYGC